MLSEHIAYLFWDLIFFPLWLGFFFYRKDLRVKMLSVSIVTGIIATFWAKYFVIDYWHPLYTLGVEDFLYGLFFGGIACAIYQMLFFKRSVELSNKRYHWRLFALPIAAISLLIFNIPFFFLHIDSIYCAFLTYAGIIFIMLYFRKDLFFNAFISGLAMSFLTILAFLLYLFVFPSLVTHWWEVKRLSGIFLFGIPLEEIIWSFGVGMILGPSYEFFNGIQLTSLKLRQAKRSKKRK